MTEQKFSIDREKLQDVFCDRLNRIGFDAYGFFFKDVFEESNLYKKHPELLKTLQDTERLVNYTQNGETETNMEYHIPLHNDTLLIIRPFYWGELTIVDNLPNFVYPLLDLQISWYKYALRVASANMPVTVDLINQVFDTIEDTLIQNKKETINVTAD